MNAPRYAVYMMLDEPHATKATYGYATAGWVIAPAVGKVIARIGPMLGMLPDIADKPTIDQALYIPLEPGRPPGVTARGPGVASVSTDHKPPAKSTLTVTPTVLPPAMARPSPDLRRETNAQPMPGGASASVMTVSTAPSVVGR
jgi:cell division protein FtsI (penicillin-binding protein 3)